MFDVKEDVEDDVEEDAEPDVAADVVADVEVDEESGEEAGVVADVEEVVEAVKEVDLDVTRRRPEKTIKMTSVYYILLSIPFVLLSVKKQRQQQRQNNFGPKTKRNICSLNLSVSWSVDRSIDWLVYVRRGGEDHPTSPRRREKSPDYTD